MSVLPTPEPPGPNPGQPGHYAHTDWVTASLHALDDDIVPVGVILMWSAGSPPNGWLICDGGTFQATLYPRLATLLGDTFGAHSGDDYYLPNYRSKFPLGASSSHPPASSAAPLMTGDQVGSHTHTVSGTAASAGAHDHSSKSSNGDGNSSVSFRRSDGTNLVTASGMVQSAGAHTHSVSGTAAASAAAARPYYPPYLALHFIIRAG